MLEQNSYQTQWKPAKFCAVIVGIFIAVCSVAQSPFNGISIEEVPIDATSLASIDAELDAGNGGPASARCWRIYVCLDDPDWELQAFWGDATNQWHLDTGTEFYQNSFGQALGGNINPAFYGVIPGYEYDSWFTINVQETPSNTNFLAGLTNPMTQFETGTGFLVNDALGSSIFGTWLPPSNEGQPSVDARVLIAQFTTDGTFWGTMNFKFRRLDATGQVYLPTEVVFVHGIFINGLSPGAVPDVCPITFLPVELLNFNAEPVHDQVSLTWATASEINNEYFTVERSSDRENWEEVVRMDGHGSTDLMNQYSTIDPRPLPGTSYYRLRQTDTNGEFSHSYVVPVTFLGEEIEVYPNPTQDTFFVKGDLSNVNSIQVIDSRGRIISFDANTDLNREWNLAELNLERGVYFVEFILNSGASFTEKLILH